MARGSYGKGAGEATSIRKERTFRSPLPAIASLRERNRSEPLYFLIPTGNDTSRSRMTSRRRFG